MLDASLFVRECLGWTPDERQTELLRVSPRRCLLNCTRQWGKSTVTAAKAVHTAFFAAGSLTLVVSPSARQSGEFLRKASEFLKRLDIAPRGDGDHEMSLLLPNGSRIVGLPGREKTVRGFSSVALLLVDEAARAPEDLYLAVRPMVAVGGGGIWLMSTPNGRRGFFFEAWEKGGTDWVRIAVPATECARIPASHLEEERATMNERWFRQEYLCEFVEAEESLFDYDMLDRAIYRDAEGLNL